jgi:hypothetical protein
MEEWRRKDPRGGRARYTAPGWWTASTAGLTKATMGAAVILLLAGGLGACVAIDDRKSVTPAPRCPMGHQDKRDCMPDSGRGLCTKANRGDC